MHTLWCTALAILSCITPSFAMDSPAMKDSTILRSTANCSDCPESNCYKCTLGHEGTIKANTDGLADVRTLVGFQLSDPVAEIKACWVQFPAFVRFLRYPVNVTVARALSSDWDEDTVTGENAPESGDVFFRVAVPELSNMPRLDVTAACKTAQTDGQFSVYIGTEFDSIEIWSRDAGYPAYLHVKML